MSNPHRFSLDHPYLAGRVPPNDFFGLPITGTDANGYPVVCFFRNGNIMYAQLNYMNTPIPPGLYTAQQLQSFPPSQLENYARQLWDDYNRETGMNNAVPVNQGGYNNAVPVNQSGYNNSVVQHQNSYNNRGIPQNQGGYNNLPQNQGGYNNIPTNQGGYNNAMPSNQGGYNNMPPPNGGFNTLMPNVQRRPVAKPTQPHQSVLGKLSKSKGGSSPEEIKAAQRLFDYESYRMNHGFDIMDMLTTPSGQHLLLVSAFIPISAIISIVSPFYSALISGLVYILVATLLINQSVKDYDIQEYVKEVRMIATKIVVMFYATMFIITFIAGLSHSAMIVSLVLVSAFLMSLFCPGRVVSMVLDMESRLYSVLNSVAEETRQEVKIQMSNYVKLQFDADTLLFNEETGAHAAELEDGSLILTNQFGVAQLDERGQYIRITEDNEDVKVNPTPPTPPIASASKMTGSKYVVREEKKKSGAGIFDQDDGVVVIEKEQTPEEYILSRLDEPAIFSKPELRFFSAALPYLYRVLSRDELYSTVQTYIEDLLDEKILAYDHFKFMCMFMKTRSISLISLPIYTFQDKVTEDYVKRLRRDLMDVQSDPEVSFASLQARITFYNIEGQAKVINEEDVVDAYSFTTNVLHLFDRIMESKVKTSLYGNTHVPDTKLREVLPQLHKYYEQIDENCPLDVVRQKLFII